MPTIYHGADKRSAILPLTSARLLHIAPTCSGKRGSSEADSIGRYKGRLNCVTELSKIRGQGGFNGQLHLFPDDENYFFIVYVSDSVRLVQFRCDIKYNGCHPTITHCSPRAHY